jgi:hypothetical protein
MLRLLASRTTVKERKPLKGRWAISKYSLKFICIEIFNTIGFASLPQQAQKYFINSEIKSSHL